MDSNGQKHEGPVWGGHPSISAYARRAARFGQPFVVRVAGTVDGRGATSPNYQTASSWPEAMALCAGDLDRIIIWTPGKGWWPAKPPEWADATERAEAVSAAAVDERAGCWIFEGRTPSRFWWYSERGEVVVVDDDGEEQLRLPDAHPCAPDVTAGLVYGALVGMAAGYRLGRKAGAFEAQAAVRKALGMEA